MLDLTRDALDTIVILNASFVVFYGSFIVYRLLRLERSE